MVVFLKRSFAQSLCMHVLLFGTMKISSAIEFPFVASHWPRGGFNIC